MKKALLILLSAWVLKPADAEAQNIVLGEKVLISTSVAPT